MALNILLLEDDTAFAKIVQIRLRHWKEDLQFFHATNIAAARKLIESDQHFDLAILDHHLPDGVGSDLFDHEKLQFVAVLAVSSDENPEIPAKSVIAGAQHFLNKRQVIEPLFIPLLEALIERKHLERELLEARLKQSALETIRVLLATLDHEINNPLGAVLGGAYLLRTAGSLDAEQKEALKLIEESGNRIKHVIKELRSAANLEQVTKGKVETFHIPGDKPWGK